MVKNVIIGATVALMMLVVTSCFHDLPEIGRLAGQWQITEIAYPDGHKVERPERYYCFYRTVGQLTAPGGVKVTANMDYEYPDLSLEFPYDPPGWLAEWGIIAPEGSDATTRNWVQRYHIDRLDGGHLVMTTEQGVTITLRKY